MANKSINEGNKLKFLRPHIVSGNHSMQVDTPSRFKDNSGGGEPPMDKDKYVTHTELELSNEKLLRHIDEKFSEMDKRFDKRFNEIDKRFNEVDKRFNEVDKHFNEVELKLNDVKNTANNNKEKINWLLYTVVGGIVISIMTTIISNLLTK